MASADNLPKPVTDDVKKDIESFDASKLQHAETKDSTTALPSPDEIKEARKELERRESIEKFSKSQLKHAETEEKIVLPTIQDVNQEKTIHSIEEFDKSALKPAETVVKNSLPTKDVIEEEKRTSTSS